MSKKIASFLNYHPIYFVGIILLIFCVRLININYNSIAGFEAVYLKAGQDTSATTGGSNFFYPLMTSIAYTLGGIAGSRIVNVILSIVTLYFVGKITFAISEPISKNKNRSVVASIVSIVLVGFAFTTSYISRIATNDVPSFLFLTSSLFFMTRAVLESKNENSAKDFFISAASMSIAFAFKYISILYLPIITIASLLYFKNRSKNTLGKVWLLYFAFPLVVCLSLISLGINSLFAENLWYNNLFLLVLPLGIAAGVGTTVFLQKKVWSLILAIFLIGYIVLNQFEAQKFNSAWPNYSNALNFLSQNTTKDDNLLAEETSSILLPSNVFTFNRFSYKGLEGAPAYKAAVSDGYFNYIELNNGLGVKSDTKGGLKEIVSEQMADSYFSVFSDGNFSVYKRGF